MWPRPILITLAALTLQALASTLSTETTLMLFMENFHVPHDEATWITGGLGVLLILTNALLARAIDQLTTPWLPFMATLAAFFLRMALTGLILLPGQIRVVALSPTWQFLLLIVLLFLLMAMDQLIGQSLWLAMDRNITRSLVHDKQEERTRLSGDYYSLGNAGAAVAMLLYDGLRAWAPNPATANGLVQAFGAMTSLLVLALLIWTFYWQQPTTSFSLDDFLGRPKGENPSCLSLWSSKQFWRFIAFCVLLLGVSTLFRHLDQTLPVVMQRLYSPTVHFAFIQALNPLLIIGLGAWIQRRTVEYNSYRIIVAGTFISSTSFLVLVINGPGPGHLPWDYLVYALFMCIFSVGEALWSPRLNAFMMQIAPVGQQAQYMALAKIPPLGARILSAWHSGWLVRHYCGATDQCTPRSIWLPIWLLSTITPIGLTLGFQWLNPAISDKEAQLKDMSHVQPLA